MFSSRRKTRGGSLLEMSLLLPWYVFLFVGVFDWGYYSHALISTQAAARSAVLYTSQSSSTATDQATACTYAANELKISSNIPAGTTCSADPLVVTATQVTGADGNSAASVTVKYHTLNLVPIPQLLNQQFWIVQTVQMRLRS
jgi:Flp pilus assembly protein TadG